MRRHQTVDTRREREQEPTPVSAKMNKGPKRGYSSRSFQRSWNESITLDREVHPAVRCTPDATAGFGPGEAAVFCRTTSTCLRSENSVRTTWKYLNFAETRQWVTAANFFDSNDSGLAVDLGVDACP